MNTMKIALPLSLLSIALTGCPAKFQAPFSVEDPTVKGSNEVSTGDMINSTKARYWIAYKEALEKNGYEVQAGQDDAGNDIPFPGFYVKGLETTAPDTDQAKAANVRFWKEGRTYARTLCSDFFRRVAITYSQREHARMQTNVGGGLLTGIMGLADVSSGVVGGTGLAFSSAESAFNAYNESFMVTADLGLMKALVETTQGAVSSQVDINKLEHVTDVLDHLNAYVSPCTYTGMQNLLDDSLNKKMEGLSTWKPAELKTFEEIMKESGKGDQENTPPEGEEKG